MVFIPANSEYGLRKYKAYYRKGGHLLYCTRKDEEIHVAGLRSVYISEWLPRMLIQRATQQLDDYLAVNLREYEMYRCDGFWQDALLYAGRPIIPKAPYVLDTHVEQGYVTIYAGDRYGKDQSCSCRYDLVREELSLRYDSWQREGEIPPQDFMGYFFDGMQRQILALRQLDRGTMPEPYRTTYLEIARINGFLKGKRTVRAWFDGRTKGILCYPRDVQTAAFLIKVEDATFINHLYNYRHDEEGNEFKKGEITTLPYKLSHYSEELTLHRDAFAAFELISADPRVREKLEREAKRSEMNRLIEETGGGVFYEIDLLVGGHVLERLITSQDCASLEELYAWQPAGERLLQLYIGHSGRLEVRVIKHSVGVDENRPVSDELLEIIRKLPHTRWHEMKGYSRAEDDVQFTQDALFQFLDTAPALSDSEKNGLRKARLRFLIPSDTQYLFTVLELDGNRSSAVEVVSGHPLDGAEIHRLGCAERFAIGHPEDRMLNIHPHYLIAGEGKNVPLPDELMAMIADVDPMEILLERSFRSAHPEHQGFFCCLERKEKEPRKG